MQCHGHAKQTRTLRAIAAVIETVLVEFSQLQQRVNDPVSAGGRGVRARRKDIEPNAASQFRRAVPERKSQPTFYLTSDKPALHVGDIKELEGFFIVIKNRSGKGVPPQQREVPGEWVCGDS